MIEVIRFLLDVFIKSMSAGFMVWAIYNLVPMIKNDVKAKVIYEEGEE